ncbi:hypothetical protein Pyn_29142 [Prunus yedoensis var. nudiflora]|uniref:Uncharacterized protein n=1 Tax=Prunus yedoensis var. nudiflora TaxID=2094558 RepID=A0A314YLI3_PRUYE|nr:hypothetical protein Pyn_29142 [Prunus yedoensis var. nudiflora]
MQDIRNSNEGYSVSCNLKVMLLLPSLTDYFSWVVVEVELFCAQKIVTFLKVRKWKRQLPLQLGTLNSEGLKNNHLVRKLEKHQQICTLDQHIEEQFGGGCLLACIIAWVRPSA